MAIVLAANALQSMHLLILKKNIESQGVDS